MADELKQKIEKFYNEVGWQQEADGLYQNARYEDLRLVSADYIARAHKRVAEHLLPAGQYLLDAGSGPVQYEAYLQYSKGYAKRVCLDISVVALQEARKKLGDKGFYVVADVANLPFKSEVFDGIVSLHTIHHIAMKEKEAAYLGLYRCLKPGRTMVTVDGWADYKLSKVWARFEGLARRRSREFDLTTSQPAAKTVSSDKVMQTEKGTVVLSDVGPSGTFVAKNSADWFKRTFTGKFPFQIRSWRSVSVHFLRTVIREDIQGQRCLALLSWLEDCFPRFFGENGQYPLIVVSKPKTN